VRLENLQAPQRLHILTKRMPAHNPSAAVGEMISSNGLGLIAVGARGPSAPPQPAWPMELCPKNNLGTIEKDDLISLKRLENAFAHLHGNPSSVSILVRTAMRNLPPLTIQELPQGDPRPHPDTGRVFVRHEPKRAVSMTSFISGASPIVIEPIVLFRRLARIRRRHPVDPMIVADFDCPTEKANSFNRSITYPRHGRR
jgi:hypothetical protein